jgi:hypothetical protein
LDKSATQLSALASLPKDLQTQVNGTHTLLMYLCGVIEVLTLGEWAAAFVEDDATAQLCLTALSTQHKKAIEFGISGLNKLVSHKALGAALVSVLIPKLPKIVDQEENDSNLLLKTIQLIVALWNPPAYRIHGEDFGRVLGILFKLASTPRPAMIHQAAEASIRQIFMEFYDQAASGATAAAADSEPSSHHIHTHDLDLTLLDLSRLMKDLCNITGGQDPVWLPAPLSFSDAGFAFDRFEELLAHPGMSQVIISHPDLSSVVRDRIFPLMHQSLCTSLASVGSSQLANIPSALKIMRTSSQLLGHYHSVSTAGAAGILDAIMSPLDASFAANSSHSPSHTLTWQKYLALSCLRTWMNLPELVIGIGKQHMPLLDRTCAKLSAFIQSMFSWDISEFHVMDLHLSTGSQSDGSAPVAAPSPDQTSAELTRKLRLFPHLKSNTLELPMGTQSQASLILSALHALLGMVDTMASVTSDPLQDPQRADDTLPKEFAASCWPSLLAAFSLFLAKSKDEAFILLVLRGYQTFCRACALIDLSTPRDAFLTSLCKFAKPQMQSSPAGVTVGMGVVAELEREGLAGTSRLTKKNVLTMKILLNISHSLAPYLGESAWAIGLDTLHQLFVILSLRRRSRPSDAQHSQAPENSQSDSRQSMESSSGSAGDSSAGQPSDPLFASKDDEDMLFNTLESLFSSTKFMQAKGLVTLVSGLIALSRSRLAELVSSTPLKDAAGQHLFPLTKAFQVVAADVGRLGLVWDNLLHHVVSVAATHRNPDVRIFAARRLTELIEQGVASPSAFESPMQDRLLEALEQLVTQSVYPEVRIEAVESLFRVLGSSGPALSSSTWSVVLSVLMAVGLDTTDSALLSLGFKCAQLVVADYVSMIPVDCLSVLISMVGCYAGKSVVDVNINITAVGLLWNIADSLAKEHQRIRENESSSDARGESGMSNLTVWDSLWYALLQELVVRADNRRSEIRHAALQTLFGCMYTYGGRFISANCWAALWPHVLLPLLPWMSKNTTSASSDTAAPNGMLVDHSRNTELKQWLETHVVLLTGLVKVFKTFFDDVMAPQVSLLSVVSAALLDHIEKVLLSEPRPLSESDVLVSAVSALKDIVQATYYCKDARCALSGSERADIAELTTQCWSLWLRTARQYRISDKNIPQRLLSAFVDSISEVYPKVHTSGGLDLHWVVAIAAELPLFPLEYVGELVILQKQTLSILQSSVDGSLVGTELPRSDLRPHVVGVLLSYLARVISLPFQCGCFITAEMLHGHELSLSGLLSPAPTSRRELPLAERALTTLSALMVTQSVHMSVSDACALFPDIVTVCGEVMLVRHDPQFQRALLSSSHYANDSSRLWFISQDVLRQCARICLPHIHQHFSSDVCASLWTNFLDSVEAFILASQSKDLSSVDADVAWIEETRVVFLSACAHTDVLLQKRMISLLLDAVDQVDREPVVEAALRNVFDVLGADSSNSVQSAPDMLPMFLSRVSDIISRFVADDQTSGALPLPSARMRQMTRLLEHLLQLRTQRSLWTSRHPVDMVDSSDYRHLFELFPILCDCITVKDLEVQIALKAIFRKIGTSFLPSGNVDM